MRHRRLVFFFKYIYRYKKTRFISSKMHLKTSFKQVKKHQSYKKKRDLKYNNTVLNKSVDSNVSAAVTKKHFITVGSRTKTLFGFITVTPIYKDNIPVAEDLVHFSGQKIASSTCNYACRKVMRWILFRLIRRLLVNLLPPGRKKKNKISNASDG